MIIGVALCAAGARAQPLDMLGTGPSAVTQQQPPVAPQPAAAPAAPVAAQDAQAPAQAPGYAWADSCKSCHQAIYDAWAKTKHATALNRLSNADQEKDCIGCHVTGPKARVMDGRKVLNAGIQCESCHGAAAAHAADPAVRTGLVRKPAQNLCVECHSDKGPHYRGFYYAAMVPIVHKVTK